MDHIDREILQILQHNARASLKTIAEKTFLSSPAVSARIEKLEKDQVITGYQAQINPMSWAIIFLRLSLKRASGGQAEVLPIRGIHSQHTGMQQRNGRIFCDDEVAFESTVQLDTFLGQLQKFGKTSTQVVFATHVGPRGVQVQDRRRTRR